MSPDFIEPEFYRLCKKDNQVIESRNDKARQKAGFALNRVVPHERDQNEPSVITGMGAGRGLSLGLHMQYIIVTHSDQK